jgi:hypothetical protein
MLIFANKFHMTDAQLYTRLHFLKPSLKSQVYDFVDFLFTKQKRDIKSKKPQFGCAKGRFKMSSDFDSPLEDLKEYMY